MDILDIAIAKQLAGGGGGSGTDNYNDLSNLPKINDVTLSGNKTSANLGLQSEINSDSKLASDLIDDTNQDNKFVTSTEKNTWNAKQNAIDADHKLNADYVDDSTSTNKFVTASDKEAWNAKQNAIDNSHKLSSDLVDDANHTNKFVTSTEKNTWNGKQNAIDSEHKLSSSLVSFTTAEAAALASGIDSTKVAQISTNQSNILYVLGKTGKNLFEFTAEGLKQRWDNGTWNGNTFNSNFGVTIVVNDNKSIVVTGTPNTQTSLTLGIYDHTKYKGCIYSGGTSNVSTTTCISGVNNIGYDYGDGVTMTGDTDRAIQIAFFTGTNLNITFKPMICTADDWAVGHDFAPYALPNYDLTRLEAEDRASLAEVVDSGAKNLLDYNSWKTIGIHNGTAVWENNGVTLTATANDCYTNWGASEFPAKIPVKQGQKIVMSWDYEIASNIDALAYIFPNGSSSGSVGIGIRNGYLEYTVSSGIKYITFRVGVMGTGNVAKYKNIMICTKAAFGVSNKFVPFGNDPFYQVPINHNMIYRGRNLGASLTDAQHTALSSGNFTDLYLGDYWTKTVTIPAGTYKGGDSEEVTVPAQTNITLKAVIADFDTFYAGYASTYAGINTHHAAVIVTGFSNVVWNKTNSTAGGYVASLIHKWLVGSALPQIETWFGSAKVLSHQKLLTNAITGNAASGWAWSSQKISLLSENQMYGSKVWGGSKATNGGYEPGDAFKHLNVFNHIDANLLFGNKIIWLRDIASAGGAASLGSGGSASYDVASYAGIAPAALILLS